MKTFFQCVQIAGLGSGPITSDKVGIRGFDPCGPMATADRLRITVTVGKSCEVYLSPTPSDARTLAAALLTAADTFEGGSGAYLVRYMPSPPVYPEKPVTPRDFSDVPCKCETCAREAPYVRAMAEPPLDPFVRDLSALIDAADVRDIASRMY